MIHLASSRARKAGKGWGEEGCGAEKGSEGCLSSKTANQSLHKQQ